MIWMIEKGLIEVGGLEEEILEIERNGSEGCYFCKYDGDEFSLNLKKGFCVVVFSRDNPFLVDAFNKWIGYRYYFKVADKSKITYYWNPYKP